MPMSRLFVAPLLGAASAAIWAAPVAVAIWAAPTAMAQPDEPSCSDMGNDTVCQTPGNVQIDAAPPVVDYGPEYPSQYPYWEGDSIDVGPVGPPPHR